MVHYGCVVFFTLWALLWIPACVSIIINVKWEDQSLGHRITSACVVLCICLLAIDLTEGLAHTVLTICLLWNPVEYPQADASNLTCIINYNLLAYSKDDVDACFELMHDAFLGNVSENVSAVLVSATRDEHLQQYEMETRDKYRRNILCFLLEEGKAYLSGDIQRIPAFRFHCLWCRMELRYGREQLQGNLSEICRCLSNEFMCVQRTSSVLKKCGQYQDLMLLSEGYMWSFTYTDTGLYGKKARLADEAMFNNSADVLNIRGRRFDYTFVLDGDTKVKPGDLHTLLGIAAMNPGRGILQPAIDFEVTKYDTLYMHVENWRQMFGQVISERLGKLFGQCGFFGKGLIKNKLYIDRVIGYPEKLVEAIPVDVLSHDTYEAAILKPLHVPIVSLVEKPPFNYLSWNSRLRRWNLGDMILAMHFCDFIGKPLKALQRHVQKEKYVETKVRTPLQKDLLTLSICSGSIRSVFVKPVWLFYIFLHSCLSHSVFKHQWILFLTTILILCVMSKIPSVIKRPRMVIYIIPEIIASTLQFTAEVLVGTVRFIRIMHALLHEKYNWVPQRVIEKELDTNNVCEIWRQSWKHLWAYTVLGVSLLGILRITSFSSVSDIYVLLYFNLGAIAFIPLYCFVTSLRPTMFEKADDAETIEEVTSEPSTSSETTDCRSICVELETKSFEFVGRTLGRSSSDIIINFPEPSETWTDSWDADECSKTDSTFSESSKVTPSEVSESSWAAGAIRTPEAFSLESQGWDGMNRTSLYYLPIDSGVDFNLELKESYTDDVSLEGSLRSSNVNKQDSDRSVSQTGPHKIEEILSFSNLYQPDSVTIRQHHPGGHLQSASRENSTADVHLINRYLPGDDRNGTNSDELRNRNGQGKKVCTGGEIITVGLDLKRHDELGSRRFVTKPRPSDISLGEVGQAVASESSSQTWCSLDGICPGLRSLCHANTSQGDADVSKLWRMVDKSDDASPDAYRQREMQTATTNQIGQFVLTNDLHIRPNLLRGIPDPLKHCGETKYTKARLRMYVFGMSRHQRHHLSLLVPDLRGDRGSHRRLYRRSGAFRKMFVPPVNEFGPWKFHANYVSDIS